MKKLIAMAVLAAGLVIGSAANAATVDIFLNQTGDTSWTLTVDVAAGTDLGAINMLTSGNVTSMTVNSAIATISAADSVLVADPLGTGQNGLVINNTAIGAVIAAGGSQQVLLATLGTSGGVVAGFPGDDAFGGTAFAASGDVIADVSITVRPTPPVPEPATLLMLGLGFAGLAMVRRSA